LLFSGKLPIAPVLNIGQALENPFVAQMGRIGSVDHLSGRLRVLAPVTEINGSPIEQTAAPSAGAHTSEVLSAAGFTPQQIRELRECGVIG